MTNYQCPGCGSSDTVIHYEHSCASGFTHVQTASGNVPPPQGDTKPKSVKCPGCSQDGVLPSGVYCNSCGQYFPSPF